MLRQDRRWQLSKSIERAYGAMTSSSKEAVATGSRGAEVKREVTPKAGERWRKEKQALAMVVATLL